MGGKRKRLKLKKKILKITKGILSRLSEVVLVELVVMGEILTTPPGKMTMRELDRRISKRLGLSPNLKRTKNLIYQAQKRGLLTKNFKLTKQGEKRLKELFPSWREPPKWDRKWYLVIFDIPEKLRVKRNILREYLRKLGFGQLQQSVWISPYNYFYQALKLVQKYEIGEYVIFSIGDKIGLENSQELAEKVWKLSNINQEYEKFIKKYSSGDFSRFELKMDYFSIIRKDPQLPKELLPPNWKGKEAFLLYQKLSKTPPLP
jgi:DNA-binding transcriptional regulator PaaX